MKGVNPEISSISYNTLTPTTKHLVPHILAMPTTSSQPNATTSQPNATTPPVEVKKRKGRPKGWSPLNPLNKVTDKKKKRKIQNKPQQYPPPSSSHHQQQQQALPKPIVISEQHLISMNNNINSNQSISSLPLNDLAVTSSSTTPTKITTTSSSTPLNDISYLNTSTFTTDTADSLSSSVAYDGDNDDSIARPRTYQIQTRRSSRTSTDSFKNKYEIDTSLEYISRNGDEDEDDDDDSIPEIDLNISSPNIRPLSPFSRSEHEVQTSPKLGESCNYPTSIYYGEKDRYRRDPKS